MANSLENNKEDLQNFLASLEDFSPTIPDEVIQYYLSKTGFECTDVRVKRLIALAVQKFISDIANDAIQHCKVRQAADKHKKDKRMVLTMEDLVQSLKEYGVSMKKPEYYVDS